MQLKSPFLILKLDKIKSLGEAMIQPEIGIKIAELRRQKGWTQEELAYRSHLNVRSIQRIELGEVTPRFSTLKLLSEVFGLELSIENDDGPNLWLVLMHLSCVIPLMIVPLLIWTWKRAEIPEIDRHGVDVLNFQISMSLYLFVSAVLVLVIIGEVLLLALGIFIIFISITNAIRVAMELNYYYPMAIHFIKRG
ncbi:MAG: helix-turn-helix domain-containing protein [Bacteroidetes bacterium]|nr:helix-turn-helix domain-containing protein [Bacteroidota bacterium]